MSNPIELFATANNQAQEAAGAAVKSWSDGMGALAQAQSAMAESSDLYARYLGGMRTVLAGQRQLMDAMVDAAKLAQSYTHQATKATEGLLDSMEAAAAGFADFSKSAANQSSSLARSAGQWY